MVLIIMKSYGLKNPFHLTSEVPVSSTELWLPVTRNKSIERTSYQFADRGAIRNFSPFFRYFANVVFINISAGKWQTTFTSINLLLAINVKSVNDLLVVELIFQFCAFREK